MAEFTFFGLKGLPQSEREELSSFHAKLSTETCSTCEKSGLGAENKSTKLSWEYSTSVTKAICVTRVERRGPRHLTATPANI